MRKMYVFRFIIILYYLAIFFLPFDNWQVDLLRTIIIFDFNY